MIIENTKRHTFHIDEVSRESVRDEVDTPAPETNVEGLSQWSGWDQSRMPWSEAKHKDEVCYSVFRGAFSVEDAATLIGFIERTWPRAAREAEGRE